MDGSSRFSFKTYKRSCFLLFYLFVPFAYSCISVPLSVSTLDSCSGSNCITTQRAFFDIPAVSGSEACLDFRDISTGALIKTVNITLSHSHYVVPIDYCYFTDDAVVSSVGFCGCPLGTTATCSSCPVINNGDGFPSCTGGTHNSLTCPIQGFTGQFCMTHKVSGYMRYKVCKLKRSQQVLDMTFTVTDGTNTFAGNFQGPTEEFEHGPSFINLTVVSSDAKNPFEADYIVYDTYDSSDFYLLDDSDVNSINEETYSKIGWMKVNSPKNVTVPASFPSETVVRVVDCQNNAFSVHYPFKQTTELLLAGSERLTRQLGIDAFVLDGAFRIPNNYVGIPDHNSLGLEIMSKDSLLFFKPGSVAVTFVGFTLKGTLRSESNIAFINYQNSASTTTNATLPSCNSFCNATGDFLGEDCVSATNGFHLAVNKFSGVPFWCLAPAATRICTPNMEVIIKIAPGEALFSISVNSTGSLVIRQTIRTSSAPHMDIETKSGIVNTIVEFSNFTISFPSSIANPKINSVTQEGNFIKINANSITSPGDCFISSEPAGSISAQLIKLTNTPQDYTIPLILVGDIDTKIVIRCHQNVVQKSFKGTTVSSESDVEDSSANVSNPQSGFLNWGDAEDFWTFKDPLSGINPLDDFNMGTILNYVLIALLLLALIFIGVRIFRKLIKRKKHFKLV